MPYLSFLLLFIFIYPFSTYSADESLIMEKALPSYFASIEACLEHNKEKLGYDFKGNKDFFNNLEIFIQNKKETYLKVSLDYKKAAFPSYVYFINLDKIKNNETGPESSCVFENFDEEIKKLVEEKRSSHRSCGIRNEILKILEQDEKKTPEEILSLLFIYVEKNFYEKFLSKEDLGNIKVEDLKKKKMKIIYSYLTRYFHKASLEEDYALEFAVIVEGLKNLTNEESQNSEKLGIKKNGGVALDITIDSYPILIPYKDDSSFADLKAKGIDPVEAINKHNEALDFLVEKYKAHKVKGNKQGDYDAGVVLEKLQEVSEMETAKWYEKNFSSAGAKKEVKAKLKEKTQEEKIEEKLNEALSKIDLKNPKFFDASGRPHLSFIKRFPYAFFTLDESITYLKKSIRFSKPAERAYQDMETAFRDCKKLLPSFESEDLLFFLAFRKQKMELKVFLDQAEAPFAIISDIVGELQRRSVEKIKSMGKSPSIELLEFTLDLPLVEDHYLSASKKLNRERMLKEISFGLTGRRDILETLSLDSNSNSDLAKSQGLPPFIFSPPPPLLPPLPGTSMKEKETQTKIKGNDFLSEIQRGVKLKTVKNK